jgi:ribosomal protein S2
MVGEENNKTAEAKKLGIPIIAIDEFKLKYNL